MSKTALVTGATSGIGAAYAKRLASDGYNLILTGRRADVIRKLADELAAQHKVQTKVILAELSNDSDVQKVIDAIEATDDLEFLVNNAGFNDNPEYFVKRDFVTAERMMKVLMTTPVQLCHAAIPGMAQRGRGVIINVSSGAAVLPAKKSAIYAASKAFIKAFSESLYLEVKDKGIMVQTVCPGYIPTDFYRGFTADNLQLLKSNFRAMSADAVVESSMKDLAKNRAVCVPGAYYKMMLAMVNVAPRSFWYRRIDKMIQ